LVDNLLGGDEKILWGVRVVVCSGAARQQGRTAAGVKTGTQSESDELTNAMVAARKYRTPDRGLHKSAAVPARSSSSSSISGSGRHRWQWGKMICRARRTHRAPARSGKMVGRRAERTDRTDPGPGGSRPNSAVRRTIQLFQPIERRRRRRRRRRRSSP
jgi:hypothetical protein